MTSALPPVSPASPKEIEAARLLLSRMGISLADLLDAPVAKPSVPTFAEYIPVVRSAIGETTRPLYDTYWNRVLRQWGNRRLDEPTPSEIKQLVDHARTHAEIRRSARGGRTAAEHMVSALRCLYRNAESDGFISEADNPARKVPKPRRLPSNRRAISDECLAEINHAAATTGDDPFLDTLLLRLHTETACRVGGAIALRPRDLDPLQCLIFLREKGGTTRWQPVSPTLMTHLAQHAEQRGADEDQQLLRYRNGRPLTRRRYDSLWKRLGKHIPWVATQQITAHWLRHTTLTWVERNFGHAVAAAYAGHSVGNHGEGATSIYTRATLEEIATALAALTREPHPLSLDVPG